MRACWLCVLLACAVTAIPLNPEYKPSLNTQKDVFPESGLLQLERPGSAGGDDEVLGGFGVHEAPVLMDKDLPTRPLASLLEEDEGAADIPCDECNVIGGIPEGFSGDLNELAELAYLPPTSVRAEAQRRHDLLHPRELPPDDNKGNGERFMGMRPGDEMVGGFGLRDSEDVINLELDEGAASPAAQADVPSVSRKTEVLKHDLEAKHREVEALSAQLESLKSEKLAAEQRVKLLRESEDGAIAAVRAQKDAELEKATADYKASIEAAKSSSAQRAVRVAEVEGRIAERKLSDEETHVQVEKQAYEQKLSEKRAALAKLREETAKSEQRVDALYSKAKLKLFSDGGDEEMGVVDGGLRSTLSKMSEQIEEVEHEEEVENEHISELTAQAREESSAKSVLESRLKNLKAREEAVRAEEHKYEAANANLRHEIDEEEVAQEENAEELAHARQAKRSAPSDAENAEEAHLTDEEREYERVTLQAANDEIARLKAELAKRERLEEHAEEELIQQEQAVSDEGQQARELADEAHNLKLKSEAEVNIKIFDAKSYAAELVREAEAKAPAIEAAARAEMVDEGKADRAQIDATQKVRASELKQHEAETKRESNEAREKLEEELKAVEDSERAQFEKEKTELIAQLKQKTEQELEEYRHSKEELVNDKSADLVMAKIHSGKNDQQLQDLQKQNADLEAALGHLEKQIEQQKREWAFQELVAQQNIGFSGADEE